jgi:hypothetical protein
VPDVAVRRRITDDFSLRFDSQISGDEVLEGSGEYQLSPTLGLKAGWRNAPTTRDPSKSSGSFLLGLHYGKSYWGDGLVSEQMLEKQAGK